MILLSRVIKRKGHLKSNSPDFYLIFLTVCSVGVVEGTATKVPIDHKILTAAVTLN